MKNKRQNITENLLRKYVQNEIRRIMEADEEETPSAPPAPTVKTKPVEKPVEKPKEAPVEDQGLNADFQAAMNTFVQKLKSSTEPVQHDDLIDMVGSLIDMFTSSSESKLNILRTVKTNIVR